MAKAPVTKEQASIREIFARAKVQQERFIAKEEVSVHPGWKDTFNEIRALIATMTAELPNVLKMEAKFRETNHTFNSSALRGKLFRDVYNTDVTSSIKDDTLEVQFARFTPAQIGATKEFKDLVRLCASTRVDMDVTIAAKDRNTFIRIDMSKPFDRTGPHAKIVSSRASAPKVA